ncbi:MAG: GDSL-type esterase/lipase family protein [Rickettsiales bacterium]
MRARFIVSLLVWVFLAVSSTPAFAGPTVRITIFGDDLTSGYGISNPDDKLQAILSAKLKKDALNATVTNLSLDGETTSTALKRLPQIAANPTEILILALGNNDALRQTDPEIIRNNLDQILTQMEGRSYTLFTGARARPGSGTEYALHFNNVFPELSEHHKVIFYPFLLEGIAGKTEYFQRDGVHPNEEGVQEMADKLYPVMVQMVRKY